MSTDFKGLSKEQKSKIFDIFDSIRAKKIKFGLETLKEIAKILEIDLKKLKKTDETDEEELGQKIEGVIKIMEDMDFNLDEEDINFPESFEEIFEELISNFYKKGGFFAQTAGIEKRKNRVVGTRIC